MRRKALNLAIVFFLISMFFFPVILSPANTTNIGEEPRISSPAVEIDPDSCIVKANWLYVGMDDYDYGPLPRKMFIQTGGEDLLSFTSQGELTRNNETIVYWGNGTFGYEASAGTFVGPLDACTDMDFEDVEQVFFGIYRGAVPLLTPPEMAIPFCTLTEHSVYWNTVDPGDVNIYEYNEPIPMKVGVKEMTKTAGSFVLNGEKFETAAMTADIMKVTVTNTTSFPVAPYDLIFKDVAGVDEGKVNLFHFDDFSAQEEKVINYYENSHLGWKSGLIQEGQTLAQLKYGCAQKGATWNNPSPKDNKIFDFDVDLLLAPSVNEWAQYNEITSATVLWDYQWGRLFTIKGVTKSIAPKRIVGIGTRNYGVMLHFDVDFEIFATLPLTAELSQLLLENPNINLGQFIFDSSFHGDEEADEPLESHNPLGGLLDFLNGFMNLLPYILIIIGIIGIGVIIIVRKAKKRAIRAVVPFGKKDKGKVKIKDMRKLIEERDKELNG